MLTFELDPQECREFIRQHDVARLACALNDQPYVVPVSYSFDGGRDCLYCFSAVGQKVHWMRANPKVCVEIEDISDTREWTTVLAFGRYEEILGTEDEKSTRERALDLFRVRGEWWLPGAARLPTLEHEGVVVYRIRIQRVTGRRARRGQGPDGT
jgi:nitroimidazol reductase NimA-like FMN-containing flavoprotein (pyridoxamine 5'-phosphate oxidase superfamily)